MINKKTLREMILHECGCMARDVELPAEMAASMPMLDILGYGHVDGAAPAENEHGHMEFEDSDEYEESSMIKNNLYNLMNNSKNIHDMIGDGDDLPEWVQEKIAVATEMIDVIHDYLNSEMNREGMSEAKKQWYMKKRRNMKKTTENSWYDRVEPKKTRSIKKKK